MVEAGFVEGFAEMDELGPCGGVVGREEAVVLAVGRGVVAEVGEMGAEVASQWAPEGELKCSRVNVSSRGWVLT